MNVFRSVASALLLLCSLTPLHAVIVAGGDGSQNTTSAGAGDGWNYVSTFTNLFGSFSAVYLGNYSGQYWALRARHTGTPSSTLTFNSTSVNVVAGTNVTVLNDPNNPASVTDLVLFRVDADPGLPKLNLLDSPASIGSELRLIGNGRNRESTLTRWTSSWIETTSPSAPFAGYKWDTGHSLRWGNNTIEGYGSGDYGYGNVAFFASDFDNVANEAQGADGDSGGGAFYYDALNDEWYLAGVMVTTAGFVGQPAETAVFGNLTYYLDISEYRDFILQTIPEPAAAKIGMLILGLMLIRRKMQSIQRI